MYVLNELLLMYRDALLCVLLLLVSGIYALVDHVILIVSINKLINFNPESETVQLVERISTLYFISVCN